MAEVNSGNPALTGTQPVVASNESNAGGESSSRQYDEISVQKMIQDRLAKQARKFQSEINDLKSKYEPEEEFDESEETRTPKSKTELPDSVKRQLRQAEKDRKTLTEKLEKHRLSTLKNQVVQKLNEKDCLDPELAFSDLYSKGLVKLDDEDNVVTDGVYESLDQLAEEYLGKRAYLVRSKVSGGLGGKSPKPSSVTLSDKDQLVSEIRSRMNAGGNFFSKKS